MEESGAKGGRSGVSRRAKAVLIAVIAATVALALLLAATLSRGGGPTLKTEGTWYARTDYGEELTLLLSPDNTVRLGAELGNWQADTAGDGYSCTFSGRGDVDFRSNGDNLVATVTATSPEVDDSSAEGVDEEQLVFYVNEQDAQGDYDSRLAGWEQERADYEASMKEALVGSWRHVASENDYGGSSALAFNEDGTYRIAQEKTGYTDIWTGARESSVMKGSGTWSIDDSKVTKAHAKFFRDHLSFKVKRAKKADADADSYNKVSLKDKDDPTSVRVGKGKAWEKTEGGSTVSPAKTVRALIKKSASGDSHKKTLWYYAVGGDYGGKKLTHATTGSSASYDLDGDGSNDTIAYRMEVRKGAGGVYDASVETATFSVNGSEYSIAAPDGAISCTIGLLTMDNGAIFLFAEQVGLDDDGAVALMQYRDGELEAVASNLWLGDGIWHSNLDALTTSGDKVSVTFAAQPMYTGIMYFTYEMRYAGDRLSRMGSATDSLTYPSMKSSSDGNGLKRGKYKMKAGRKVSCLEEASSGSGIAFTAEKGQKATFEQAKTVGSTMWFKVRRASDGAEGWFANGADYVEPLPFTGFVQAG